jgi:hypothetical protein
LAELKPRDIDQTPLDLECMDGTRQNIFSRVQEWINDLNAPNILWIKGHPGAGKSAIVLSLVERLLQAKRLGASFFFQRNKPAITTSDALWRTVSFELCRQYPGVRKNVLAKLQADGIRLTTINTDSVFRYCVFDPLIASGDIPAGRLPVIVVDALDECGGLGGQASAQREALMGTLCRWSQLPSKFKLVVTSRSEADIEQTFETTSHSALVISTGEDVDMHSSEDIRAYLQHEFQKIASRYKQSLEAGWPGESTIDTLTNRAAGLFIWAKTLIKFIRMGPPETQLELISKGTRLGGMADLYPRLLEIAFPEHAVQSNNAACSIFATVTLAERPLPASAITKLLNIKDNVMEDVCTRMRSVLDNDQCLQFSHKSFEDFLLDEKACPSSFYLKLDIWRRFLTIACLNTMERGLKFNICGFDSSHLRNNDVPGLIDRVENCIHLELSYSCRFWAEHLDKSEYDDGLYHEIQDFMDNRFLYWLEVLSLCKQVNQASKILKLLIDWMVVSSDFFIPQRPQSNKICRKSRRIPRSLRICNDSCIYSQVQYQRAYRTSISLHCLWLLVARPYHRSI